MKNKSTIKVAILLLVSILLLIPNFFYTHLAASPIPGKRKYTPQLIRLNSLNKMVSYIDSLAQSKNITTANPTAYFEIVNEVMEKRFYHGTASYSLSEDWVSALSSRLLWSDLNLIVDVNDILHYKWAFCGQQAFVFGAIANKKNFEYHLVSFDHHMACEILINNKWSYFDSDKEIKLKGQQRIDNRLTSLPNLKYFYPSFYEGKLHDSDLANKKIFKNKEMISWKNKTFHTVTFWASRLLWLIPILLALPNLGIFVFRSPSFYLSYLSLPLQLQPDTEFQ